LFDAGRYLWHQYIRDRGYCDGTMGLAVALTRTYYRVLTAAKIWELPRRDARAARVRSVRDRLQTHWEIAAPANGSGGAEPSGVR
jgi:hypothetical protein